MSFGRYEVLELLGRGGTGSVYRALDPTTGREVAVKVLHPSPWRTRRDGDSRRRLHREAEAAGGLSHPSIVVIFDIAPEYFVMELLAGSTLRAVLDERRRLPFAEMLALLEPIADALDYAHRNGIVHRDVRPSNIMVLPTGQPKLMDFGVAHLEMQPLTSAGGELGSPFYTAPEQIRGERVGAGADLFALAAVVYEMLAGAKAFAAGSVPAAIERVLHDQPEPLSRYGIETPAHCDDVLARALAKDPDARFTTGSELVTALRGTPSITVSRRRRMIPAVLSAPAETQDLRVAGRSGPLKRRIVSARAGLSTSAMLALTLPLASSALPRAPQPAPTVAIARSRAFVRSEPLGAILWLDGRPIGRTPLSLEALRPGIHTLRLAASGFVPTEVVLPFSPGAVGPLTFRLQAAPSERKPSSAIVRAPLFPSSAARSAGITPPRQVSGQGPTFPAGALQGATGRVVISLTVSADGTPTDLVVIEAVDQSLASAALEAVRTWRFEPARKAGVAVPFRWTITYRFGQ